MLDVDTFLTTLYVITDDFCQSQPPKRRPGPGASLSDSEVITLAIFARFSRFASERDFYRYATSHLTDAFPTLPERSQFNRLVRFYTQLIEEMALHLAEVLEAGKSAYETLDSSAMPVRNAKRRGAGWLAGYADIGWSNGLGWYEGFRLLCAVSPSGVITGFCFSSASVADQQAAETFFAVRATPNPRLTSVGSASWGPYVTDKGFEGAENHRRWLECYGARVIHPPKRNARRGKWPKGLRRWVASVRQIVETVYDKLFNTFGLWRERPHELSGLRARLAARVALHNFCIWLNEQLGRPRLAFADLLGW
ncbi:MAG: transposase [Rubrobacter sp.]